MRRSRVLSGLSCAAGVLALLAGGAVAPAAAATRAPVDLGTLPGGTYSGTTAINDKGTIAGISRTADGVFHPVRWSSDGVITQLSLPDGVAFGQTVEVNGSDTVIGYWEDERLQLHAASWDAGGTRTDLPLPAGTTYSQANDINDAGTIVGYYSLSTSGGAIRWNPDGTTTVLPLLPGSTGGQAVAINETGTIVGFSLLPDNTLHAVRWTPAGVITDLGTLGGEYSKAVDINKRGVVVGDAQLPGIAYRAVRWGPTGVISDLGTFGTEPESEANAMNDGGTVVGTSGRYPVRWTASTPVALPVLSGDSQGIAIDVNNSDLTTGISGDGFNASRAVLWDAAGNVTALAGLPGAGRAVPNDINEHGVVIGNAQTQDGGTHAVRW